jgi:succinate dehydrogenase / fumarate reductase flavoprotein subunit
MWSPGRGEGLAAAFRAGARFTNCEMGSFYNWISLDHFESSMGVEEALYNDKGENVGKKHRHGADPDIDAQTLAEWYKQVRAGNGPMHYREHENTLMPYITSVLASDAVHDRPYSDRFWSYLFFNSFSQQMSDEIALGLIGEFGPLAVDVDMKTSLPGLYAAGDICAGGSRLYGPVPTPPGRMRGSGLAIALFTGRTAGPAAAAYARGAGTGAATPAPVADQVAATDARFTAPLGSKGTMKVMEMVAEIQKVMQPVGNSLYRREDRMKAALARVGELKNLLPTLKATSPHELFGHNECAAMLLCSELFFRTSLERKESVGWFLREDYPEQGPEREWIFAQSEDGRIAIERQRVPLEGYPYRP